MGREQRAVGYVRVSKVGGREGDSYIAPELQEESIRGLAAREGLELVEVVREEDASARQGKRRPGWERAIGMVESGQAGALVVWRMSRFSRSVQDALATLDRIEAAGGRLLSATENVDNKLVRTILLAVAEDESDRIRDTFAASVASAVERGIHVSGHIPIGYRRGADRRLVPDPDATPVVLGLFERRAKGWSWAKLSVWAAEQGRPMSTTGIAGLVRNPVYLGEARGGRSALADAHEAIVPRSLWAKCQGKARPSARDGRLTGKFLLQGLALCGPCGRTLYLAHSGRRVKTPYYHCRRPDCTARAYANAKRLDDFVLASIEGSENPADPSTWVARPGGDDLELEEAEAALGEARADLDSWLEDTKLRGILGAERYADATADRVAVVNKAEADLAEARERTSGSFELVGRLWNTEWGWAERREWTERMVRSVVVQKGRGPMSERVEVELR